MDNDQTGWRILDELDGIRDEVDDNLEQSALDSDMHS